MRTPPWRSLAAAALVIALVAGGLVLVAREDDPGLGRARDARALASAWRGLVGTPRPEVALGQRVIVLLEEPSLADRVRRAGGRATPAQERRWTAAALASQQQVLAELAEQGIVARPDFQFTRVINGFSAVADPSASVLLERSPRVAGVFPVRAGFPSAIATGPVQAVAPMPRGLAAYPGTGVTVALLDTAVDPATPFLHGRVLPGYDLVEGGAAARYDRRPGGDRLETHGTTIAGIVAGQGRPGSSSGVAPDVTVLPVRVAGWQRDAAGSWSIHSRTDQVIAGLERAVDPNRDGDAHDAARITLVAVSEPFSAFPDGPLSRAVSGAVALDTLVVAPAGNDGPGGPGFGSIGGPGGAPDALTVGAADLRPETARVPVSVRAGLRVLLHRPLELLASTAPVAGATYELVRVDGQQAPLFDRRRRSRVAGRAVLLDGSAAARRGAVSAAEAGAAVVVLAGALLPGGALGQDPRLDVPVVSAPAALAGAVGAQARSGKTVWLSFGAQVEQSPARSGATAAFSSWGLAYDGHVKPDVVGSGVVVPSAGPGADADGFSRMITVSGTSAAAAVVAGLAARLAQARPELDAVGLRSALAATAEPLSRTPLESQGTGVVDVTSAATVELVADAASVTFGRGTGDGWQGRRTITLRNVSRRALLVDARARARRSGVLVRVTPKRVRVPVGGGAQLRVTARVAGVAREDVVSGVVRISPRGSQALAVPWSVLLAPPPDDLVGAIELSERSFAPSDLTPAVLSVRVGTIDRARGRDVVQPVRRLDVLLHDDDGKPLGLLARLRDVLPGRYAFGLTGRGPNGARLPPGRYEIRLRAWPEAGGRPARRAVRFAVE